MFEILLSFFGAIGDSPVWIAFWGIYKAIAALVSLGSFIGIIIVALRNERFHEPMRIREGVKISRKIPAGNVVAQQKLAIGDWERIRVRLDGSQPKNYQRAILETDALADYVLKSFGYPGETMGDRMKAMRPGQFSNLDDFWRVHKVRNEIAHGISRPITESEGEAMLSVYQKVLKELGAID